jgi:hypothetical protein
MTKPDYVRQWVGKRISFHRLGRQSMGLVVAADRRSDRGRYVTLLKVARDDGFVEYGVDADLAQLEGSDRAPLDMDPSRFLGERP